MSNFKAIFLGDVVGRPGREAVAACIPALRKHYDTGLIIANGENSNHGIGISSQSAGQMFDAGVSIITTGNHCYKERRIGEFFDAETNVLRPANYPEGSPGKGHNLYTYGDHTFGVVNLSGRVFLQALDDPFRLAKKLVAEMRERTPLILVDFHGEASSEKQGIGWYLDGLVTAVMGTHTHVQTADARILAGGTALICDVGMCGPYDSLLGMKPEIGIARMVTQMPVKFEVAEGPTYVCGVFIEANEVTGRVCTFESFQCMPKNGGVSFRAVIRA